MPGASSASPARTAISRSSTWPRRRRRWASRSTARRGRRCRNPSPMVAISARSRSIPKTARSRSPLTRPSMIVATPSTLCWSRARSRAASPRGSGRRCARTRSTTPRADSCLPARSWITPCRVPITCRMLPARSIRCPAAPIRWGSRARARPEPPPRSPRGAAPRRHFTIDIHCHVFTPEADRLTQPGFRPDYEPMLRHATDATREVNRRQNETIRDKITSVEKRLAEMDRLGIDMQAISPAPPQYYYWAPAELGRDAARLINNRIAETVAAHPDRFVGMGTVPLQAPEFAVAELERMVKELDLRGVEICTNVAGAELSEPRFRPFL